MRNPYWLALATYPRRVFSTLPNMLILVWAVLPMVGIFILRCLFPHQTIGMVFVILLASLVGCLGGCMWVHLKEQFVNSRHHLLPGFAAPHGVAFCIVGAIFLAALVVIQEGELSLLFLMAFSAALFTSVGLVMVTLSIPLTVIVIVTWIGLFANRPEVLFNPYINGEHPYQMACVLIAALAGAAWMMARLVRATEDRPAAFTWFSWARWMPQTRSSGEKGVPESRLNYLGCANEIVMPKGGGFLARASVWSRLGGSHLLLVIPLALVIFAFEWWMADHDQYTILCFWFAIITFVPAFGMMIWHGHRARLALDSLRPHTRATFLSEIGMAILISIAKIELPMLAGCLISLWLQSRGPIDWGFLAAVSVLSLGIQVFIFAMGIWMFRYNSKFLQVIQMSGMNFAVIPIIIFHGAMPIVHHAGEISIIAAIIGMLIAYDAWRRWQTTEWG